MEKIKILISLISLSNCIRYQIIINSLILPVSIVIGSAMLLSTSFSPLVATITLNLPTPEVTAEQKKGGAESNTSNQQRQEKYEINIHPSVIGFLLLTTSLTFYYLYLVYIYPDQIEALESVLDRERSNRVNSKNEKLEEKALPQIWGKWGKM